MRRTASAIAIRAARPSDKREVRAVLARIWVDDYIPAAFDDWVRDRRGGLWLAMLDGRVVGIAKLSVDGDEAWLHGLRVDPAHRREGVATALLRHRLARARRLGARVARLDTDSGNTAVKRMMQRHGFHVLARVTYFDARALIAPAPRLAARNDIDAMLQCARRDRALYHGAKIFTSVQRAHLVKAIHRGDCFIAGEGAGLAFVIVETHHGAIGWHRQGDRLVVRAIAGGSAGVRTLLWGIRGEAKRRELPRAGVSTRSAVWPAARGAGYRRRWDDTMLVYEKRIG